MHSKLLVNLKPGVSLGHFEIGESEIPGHYWPELSRTTTQERHYGLSWIYFDTTPLYFLV